MSSASDLERAKDTAHLVEGVPGADVLPARELVDVPLEVLRTELVEGADIAPFEQRPERLDPVGVRLPPDILPDRVSDPLLVGEGPVNLGPIRVELGPRPNPIPDEALEGRPLGIARTWLVGRSLAPTTANRDKPLRKDLPGALCRRFFVFITTFYPQRGDFFSVNFYVIPFLNCVKLRITRFDIVKSAAHYASGPA